MDNIQSTVFFIPELILVVTVALCLITDLFLNKKNSFNVASMQFSIHYLFDSEDKVRGLLKNVSESLKHNGYLLVTTLDGPSVFNILNKSKTNKR